MNQEDYPIIEEFLRHRYENISAEDVQELVGETVTFLSDCESNEFTAGILTEVLENKDLLKHLDSYRSNEQLTYRFGRKLAGRGKTIRATDLERRGDGAAGQDAWLTRIKKDRSNASDKDAVDQILGLSQTEELSGYQKQLQVWKGRISAIEFEALSRMTGNDLTPQLTYGLTEQGLMRFVRRARIRMQWYERKAKET